MDGPFNNKVTFVTMQSQVIGSNGVLGDHDYHKSGITLLTVLLEDDGFEDCRSRGAASQGNPLPTDTTVGGVKNTRSFMNESFAVFRTLLLSLLCVLCSLRAGVQTPPAPEKITSLVALEKTIAIF
jgi:hypothetical protein